MKFVDDDDDDGGGGLPFSETRSSFISVVHETSR